MSEPAENINLEQVSNERKGSALDELFTSRDEVVKKEQDIPEPNKKSKPESIEFDKKLKKEDKEPDKQKVEKNKVAEDEEESEVEKLQQELGRVNKALSDSKKWSHSNSKKLKAALKQAQALSEDGVLTEEVSNSLIELLQSEQPEEEEKLSSENQNPLAKLIKIANQRVDDLRELYEDDKLFGKKLNAFNFFIQHSSEDEVDEALEELTKLEDTPLKLAKKMYLIGEQYYNEFYKDFDESGGFKKFSALKKQEIEKLQKKIDKLEKKMSQYEDYDKSTFRIDELNEPDEPAKQKSKSALDDLFRERDKVVRR